MRVKKGWKRHTSPSKTYIIEYCIPPNYDEKFQIEKTGTYAYVRSCGLSLAASGNCIILDIREK